MKYTAHLQRKNIQVKKQYKITFMKSGLLIIDLADFSEYIFSNNKGVR